MYINFYESQVLCKLVYNAATPSSSHSNPFGVLYQLPNSGLFVPSTTSLIYLPSFFLQSAALFPLFLNKPLVLIRWIPHGCCIILFFLKFYFSIFLLLLLSRLLCSFLFTRLFILRAYAKINSTPKYLPDKYWECCLVADIDMHTIYSNRALRSIQLVKQVYKQNISTMRQIFPFKFETFICV